MPMLKYALRNILHLVGVEILIIVRTTTEIETSSCAKITSRMIKQGGTVNKIKQCRCKIYGCNFEIFRSFSPMFIHFIKLLLWIMFINVIFLQLIVSFTNCIVSFWRLKNTHYLDFREAVCWIHQTSLRIHW